MSGPLLARPLTATRTSCGRRPDGAACAADRLRDEAERDLPQRRKIAGAEEVRERGVDLLRGIDVAVAHALAQRLGRDVDELDLIGMVQHLVGEGLAHGNARDVLGEVLDRLRDAGR